MKVIISNNKLQRIETLLYAGLGAVSMVSAVEGQVTDGVIKIRDRTVKNIMDILNNK